MEVQVFPTVTQAELKKTEALANYTRLEVLHQRLKNLERKNKTLALATLRRLLVGPSRAGKVEAGARKLERLFRAHPKVLGWKARFFGAIRSHKNRLFPMIAKLESIFLVQFRAQKQRFFWKLATNVTKFRGLRGPVSILGGLERAKTRQALQAGWGNLRRCQEAHQARVAIGLAKKVEMFERKIPEMQQNWDRVQLELEQSVKVNSQLTDKLAALRKELEGKRQTSTDLEEQLANSEAERAALKKTLNENLKSMGRLESQMRGLVEVDRQLHVQLRENKAGFDRLLKSHSAQETQLQESQSALGKATETVAVLNSEVDRLAKANGVFQKNIFALTEQAAEKSREAKKKDSEIARLTEQIRDLTNEITKSKSEKYQFEETRVKNLQGKLETLFGENEELKGELDRTQAQLLELQKASAAAKSQLSIEVKDLKMTISKLNKEKLGLFKELSDLNDKHDTAILEASKKSEEIRTLQVKLVDYEDQLGKYRGVIEQLAMAPMAAKTPTDSPAWEVDGQEISFVSSKSHREKFSVKKSQMPVELDKSMDDVMKRVSKIHEKYAKKEG